LKPISVGTHGENQTVKELKTLGIKQAPVANRGVIDLISFQI
jgi:hypothetical protein